MSEDLVKVGQRWKIKSAFIKGVLPSHGATGSKRRVPIAGHITEWTNHLPPNECKMFLLENTLTDDFAWLSKNDLEEYYYLADE